MAEIGKLLAFTGVSFFGLLILTNLTQVHIRIPGDIYIDRPGQKIYIPVVSAVLLSAILIYIFKFLL